MIPPFLFFEVWVCMLDAMNLANLHPDRIESYLPDDDEPGLVGLENVRFLDTPKAEIVEGSEFQKAS